jgi:hypothetical protein
MQGRNGLGACGGMPRTRVELELTDAGEPMWTGGGPSRAIADHAQLVLDRRKPQDDSMLLAEATWAEIEVLRDETARAQHAHLTDAAQGFVDAFCARCPSVVLARMFLVLPFNVLPESDREFARRFVNADPRLKPSTRVLSLLGSAGHEPAYSGRRNSEGHLAIPLLDRHFVQGIPMITKLLADLEVDLQALDDGRPIATRRMLGGQNSTFYVNDAGSARDGEGRTIIPARDFVDAHRIATVFGMGGAYLDGTLAVSIFFCQEVLDRLIADRFASFISTFKMATSSLLQSGAIYPTA